MPFIDTNDGTQIFYQDRGEGEPVLFIHGWTLGADVWERQTTGLAARACAASPTTGAAAASPAGRSAGTTTTP
jgi:pimeloyl-ACP methyl ester carboxylesterase